MNMNQNTLKSLAAIQGAQDLAQEYGQQQIEQQHLLLALLSAGLLRTSKNGMPAKEYCSSKSLRR